MSQNISGHHLRLFQTIFNEDLLKSFHIFNISLPKTSADTYYEKYYESINTFLVEQSNETVLIDSSTNNSGCSNRNICAQKVLNNSVGLDFFAGENKPFTKSILNNKERIQRLQKAVSKILQKTVLAEGIAFNWHTVERFIAVMNSIGFVDCKIEKNATLSTGIKIKKHGHYFNGHAAVSFFEEKDNLTADRIMDLINEAVNDAQNQADQMNILPGEYAVIFETGNGTVLFHELVGHLVEADYIYNKQSLFADASGQKIASDALTLYDRGNSLYENNFDDEGTSTQNTVLVEKGILKNFLTDRYHSINMNLSVTGNGRRQSFLHLPQPRMTNTIVAAGNSGFEEMMASLESGLLITDTGNGQVNPLTGKYMFTDVCGFLVENGLKTKPFYNASISGNIKETLQNISMIGDVFNMGPSSMECVKENQIIPVGMGQPPVKIDKLQFF